MANNKNLKIVEFSPQLKAALDQWEHKMELIQSIAVDKVGLNPGYDQRDFGEMVEYTYDMTDEEVRARTEQYISDYVSGDPARRKQRLDEFYDRVDAFNPMELDLSCLEGNDQGERGQDGLTPSERDVMRLIAAVRRDQTVATKLKENPEYGQERYADWEKMAWKRKQDELMTAGFDNYVVWGLLYHNGYEQNLQPVRGPEVKDIQILGANAMTALEPILARFGQNNEAEGEIPFTIEDNPAYYEFLRKKQRESGNTDAATEIEDLCRNAVEAPFLYNERTKLIKEYGFDRMDLIFIDGVSVNELFAEKYADMTQGKRESMMRQEIMAAVMSGEQRVEVVTLDQNESGDVVPKVNTVKANLHALDKREKEQEHNWFRRLFDWGPFKIKTRADQADQLSETDDEKEERQRALLERVNRSIAQKREAEQSMAEHREAIHTRERSYERERFPYLQEEYQKLDEIEQQLSAIDAQNDIVQGRIKGYRGIMEQGERYQLQVTRLNLMERRLQSTRTVRGDNTLDLSHFDALFAVPFLDRMTQEDIERVSRPLYERVKPSEAQISEIWNTNGWSKELMEKRRDELAASGDSELMLRAEALDALLKADTPERQQAVKETFLNQYKEAARELITSYKAVLNQYPQYYTQDIIDEARIKSIEEQDKLTKLPKELLEQREEIYERMADKRELNGDPVVKERRTQDYVKPATREEAMDRLQKKEQEFWKLDRYMQLRKETDAYKEYVGVGVKVNNPYETKIQIQAVIDMFQTWKPDYSTLNAQDAQPARQCEQTLTELAEKLPKAQIPDNVDDMVRLYTKFSQIAVLRGQGFGDYESNPDRSSHQWGRLQKEINLLREDLREFGKEERMEALRSEMEAPTRRPQERETGIHTPAAEAPVREQAPTETQTARQTDPVREKADLGELTQEQQLADGKPQSGVVRERTTAPVRQREKGEASRSAGK